MALDTQLSGSYACTRFSRNLSSLRFLLPYTDADLFRIDIEEGVLVAREVGKSEITWGSTYLSAQALVYQRGSSRSVGGGTGVCPGHPCG